MPRRRALTLVFASLIVVFVIGAVVTVSVVRQQLIDAVDHSLDASADGLVIAIETLDADELGALASPNSEDAVFLITSSGEILLSLPAGSAADPIPLPRIEPDRIANAVGESFTVDAVDGDLDYRVESRELASGSLVVLARPLDSVADTLESLSQILLAMLFAIVGVLGVIFWRVLRRSLKPYESIVQTSKAIADGDLDRRAIDPGVNADVSTLTASINNMLDRIQLSFEERNAADARVKQFAADASHELRTPLTTIIGYSDVYLSGAATDPDAVTKQMTRIRNEAGRMALLVHDLLTLTRLDQHERLRKGEVDLAEIVSAVVDDRRASHPDHAVELTDSVIDAHVDGDAEALYQVVVNLVANTASHAPGSACRITLIRRQNESQPSDTVELVVADDGPGMDPAFAATAFDRFARADPGRSSSRSSTGLGLSIVKGIVDAHGGTVDLDTRVGAGTAVTIRLPAARRAPAGDAHP